MSKTYYPAPQEVIVVEGKSDTARLKETFGPGVRVIETQGSALDEATLDRIQNAQAQYGVIVFTDPDFPGEKIRRQISQRVPRSKHAYLTQEEAGSQIRHHSLGIEHAKPAVIYQVLQDLARPNVDQPAERIPMADLMRLGLVGGPQAKRLRQIVCDYFRLGHLNAKQLQHHLSIYHIDYNQLCQALKEAQDVH